LAETAILPDLAAPQRSRFNLSVKGSLRCATPGDKHLSGRVNFLKKTPDDSNDYVCFRTVFTVIFPYSDFWNLLFWLSMVAAILGQT